MNALAHIVRDIVSGRNPSPDDLRRLSAQECTALQDLGAVLAREPRELAQVLATAGPLDVWLSPQELARKVSAAGPMDVWLSPQDLARKVSEIGPMDVWLSPEKAAKPVGA